METKQLSQIIKAVVNRNGVLPILEDVCLTKDSLTVTNLEIYAVIPYKSNIAACVPSDSFINAINAVDSPKFTCSHSLEVTISGGKRTFKHKGEAIDNFPKLPEFTSPKRIMKIADDEMRMLKTATKFTSDDDLRPAMTGVYVGNDIAATDAHRLYYEPLEKAVQQSFILPLDAVKLITSIGGTWTVYSQPPAKPKKQDSATKKPVLQQSSAYILLENSDKVQLYIRTIDARFPEYSVVIPKKRPERTFIFDHKELSDELKILLKYANTATHQVTLDCKSGKMQLMAADFDFERSYNVELENFKFTGKGEVTEIAFNIKFLQTILSEVDPSQPVKMKVWGPTKCGIIDDRFLLMPLMLNN